MNNDKIVNLRKIHKEVSQHMAQEITQIQSTKQIHKNVALTVAYI